MCELFAMSSREPATTNLSLEEFSRHGGLTADNRDGWGLAYYDEEDLLLFKESRPAANSELVRFIEEHHLRSTFVLSHIRRATQGRPCLKNTQPFRRELGGRMHVFAHNGDLGHVQSDPRLRPQTYQPVGDTDSEYAFCSLLEDLRPLWAGSQGTPPLADRMEVLASFAAHLRTRGTANFIYSDGEAIFAHAHRRIQPDGTTGPPGLHILCRSCRQDAAPMTARGMQISLGRVEQDVALAASVPLTREDWQPLAEGELVALAAGAVIARRPG